MACAIGRFQPGTFFLGRAHAEKYRKQRQLPKNRLRFCRLKTGAKKKRTPTLPTESD
jgi:hypothetical protein